MSTYAELSIRLLKEASGFFRNMAGQNETIKTQMLQNASVFEQVAGLLEKDLHGKVGDKTYVEMAEKLLIDAANFFRSLSGHNEAIKEQMLQNAAIFEQMAGLFAKDPSGSFN